MSDIAEAFEQFRSVYPKRKGSNPWVPAQRSFEKAVKRTPPDTIINAARIYASEQRDLGHLNTPYVCQAVTWLNQQRWKDYETRMAPTKAMVWVPMGDPRWRKMAGRYYAERGVLPPHVAGLNGQGWRFPAEWLDEKGGGDFAQPSAPATKIAPVPSTEQTFPSRNGRSVQAQNSLFDG
jgi:hypothetical protein